MTLLYCTCYVYDQKSLERFKLWIEYYQEKMSKLGATHLCLIDDGSTTFWLEKLGEITEIQETQIELQDINNKFPNKSQTEYIVELKEGLNIIRFREHLGKVHTSYHHNALFPGWWRSFAFGVELARRYNFDKFIFLESDYFIVTDKLFNFIKETNGLNSLWEPKSHYAESSACWCSKSNFYQLLFTWLANKDLWWAIERGRNQYLPETLLPYQPHTHFPDGTEIIAGRYGDDLYDEVPDNPDAIGNITDISLNGLLHTKEAKKINKILTILKGK